MSDVRCRVLITLLFQPSYSLSGREGKRKRICRDFVNFILIIYCLCLGLLDISDNKIEILSTTRTRRVQL